MKRKQPFDTVLIANRGEIACRVIRGCRKLGYKTVAVYSQADYEALHVKLADTAVCIGPAPAKDSYLVIEKLIDAAKASGAQAIHPGYGFLSERADFARAVQEAGLVFIGPDAASIEAMGNKSAAKIRMRAAGVPCVPGYQGDDQSDVTLIAEARRIGMPVMIKAAAGGGGRGMRLVSEASDLAASIASARSEATNAFGDGQLLIEKAVMKARHVEIQVFGDRHGNVVHLGERDCSIQRRNQKVVEEAPSPVVDDGLRARMGAAAVAAARAVNYVGAGTVEFMLASNGAFYFLEMNTRLQVEHPVTEIVYGVDLVEWQLRIAQGEPLPLTQDEISTRRHGWAIEVRLCAEDPADNFMPQTGKVLAWRPPHGSGMRVDHGLIEGQQISPFYDSLQAKLIAHGDTREQARHKLLQMLDATLLLGVTSNRDFLAQTIAHPAFARGEFSTDFISEHLPAATIKVSRQPDVLHRALAALLVVQTDAERLRQQAGFDASLRGWHSTLNFAVPVKLRCADDAFVAQVSLSQDGTADVRLTEKNGTKHQMQGLAIETIDGCDVQYRYAGTSARARFARDTTNVWLLHNGLTLRHEDVTHAPPQKAGGQGSGQIVAPMTGKIVAVQTHAGANVRKGDTLVVLEAMKMEFRLNADITGVVQSLHCESGQQIKARQMLAVIKPAAHD